MDYKKICTDFEKRYDRKCEKIFFSGKTIIFFSQPPMYLGCSVSVGGCAALSVRADKRVVVRFSDSTEQFACNSRELEYNKDNEIARLLLSAKRCGAEVGGADILLSYNSELMHERSIMLLPALSSFCRNVPESGEMIKLFFCAEEIMPTVLSKKNFLIFFDGKAVHYLPFSDDMVKIVLCEFGEKRKVLKKADTGTLRVGAEKLRRGDFEGFGAALNAETEQVIRKNKLRATERIFDEAVRTGETYGSGILPGGGIFSVVKNSRVDTFMHILGENCGKYCGKKPRFYVTRAEDSGISVPLPRT